MQTEIDIEALEAKLAYNTRLRQAGYEGAKVLVPHASLTELIRAYREQDALKSECVSTPAEETDKPPLGAYDYAEQYARDTLSGRAGGGRFPWGQRNLSRAFLTTQTELAALRSERDALKAKYACPIGAENGSVNCSAGTCPECVDARFGATQAERDALKAALEKAVPVIEAARCIRHWHDAMRDNSGMVVSAPHVRDLWQRLHEYDAALSPTTERTS